MGEQPNIANNGQSPVIVIVGGGISGLSSAYYVQKYCREQGITAAIMLIEASEALGGKIQTLHQNGFIIEKGPDSFLARKKPIIDLTRDLGLEGELTATNTMAKKTYILHKGKLHRLPPGLMLGIPTQLIPFMKTRLISLAGKARAAMDLFLPRRTDKTDESLGQFLERRLGKEVVERIADPLLAGIYAGDTYDLSIQSTFPQFVEVEHKYRSLILGMVAGKQASKQLSNALPDRLKDSVFLSYKKGLSTLVDALSDALDGVKVSVGQSVSSIEKLESIDQNVPGLEIMKSIDQNIPELEKLESINPGISGNQESKKRYRVNLTGIGSIEADAVILATPAFAAAKLLTPHAVVKQLEDIPYVSVANVIMAFNARHVTHPLDGSGFVVPRHEKRFITACTWVSSKWQHTAPEGKVLLRCYVGRSGDEEWMYLTSENLVMRVLQDLESIMGIAVKPLFYEITRWKQSMPQYSIGHTENIKQLRKQLAMDMPGIFLTGAAYEGVGIPDCIRQGKEAAEQAVAYLINNNLKSND